MGGKLPPPTRTARHPAEESGRAFGHPIEKRPQPIRPAQRLDGVKAAGEFGFGKAGVDFLVKDFGFFSKCTDTNDLDSFGESSPPLFCFYFWL